MFLKKNHLLKDISYIVGCPSSSSSSRREQRRQDVNANYFAHSADLLSIPSRHFAEQLTYIDAVGIIDNYHEAGNAIHMPVLKLKEQG